MKIDSVVTALKIFHLEIDEIPVFIACKEDYWVLDDVMLAHSFSVLIITIFRAWFGSNEALSFANSLAYFSVRQNWFFYVSLLQRFLILMTDSLSHSRNVNPIKCEYREGLVAIVRAFLVHDSIDITKCRTMSHENDQNYDY